MAKTPNTTAIIFLIIPTDGTRAFYVLVYTDTVEASIAWGWATERFDSVVRSAAKTSDASSWIA